MNEIVKNFNNHVEDYENWFKRNRFAYESEIKLINSMIPRFERAIEVGVGSGLFSQPFGIKLGVDPSLKMLNLARERGISVIQGYAEKLPLKNGYFDFVMFVTTICFVNNPVKSLSEINKILRQKGNVLIGFVNPLSNLGKMYLRKKNESKFYKNARFFSCNEIRDILSKSGFRIVKIKQTLFNSLDNLDFVDKISDGCDEGGFISVLAEKL